MIQIRNHPVLAVQVVSSNIIYSIEVINVSKRNFKISMKHLNAAVPWALKLTGCSIATVAALMSTLR